MPKVERLSEQYTVDGDWRSEASRSSGASGKFEDNLSSVAIIIRYTNEPERALLFL